MTTTMMTTPARSLFRKTTPLLNLHRHHPRARKPKEKKKRNLSIHRPSQPRRKSRLSSRNRVPLQQQSRLQQRAQTREVQQLSVKNQEERRRRKPQSLHVCHSSPNFTPIPILITPQPPFEIKTQISNASLRPAHYPTRLLDRGVLPRRRMVVPRRPSQGPREQAQGVRPVVAAPHRHLLCSKRARARGRVRHGPSTPRQRCFDFCFRFDFSRGRGEGESESGHQGQPDAVRFGVRGRRVCEGRHEALCAPV